jgi:hypothetical protein
MKDVPMPGGDGGAKVVPVNTHSVARTEFVLLFVWREPIPGQQPQATEEKK